MAVPQRRKLIEVALPLEKINAEAAREKSIRHGHPSTLHLWWARRPLAAARAVLFAQLVDDPSSHPDRFPDEESVRVERKRLHDIIERLVVWENTRDADLMAEAHTEILASTDGHPPAILDPFCGGGTIPLEAQRLGLEAHGSDLNPVAVLITKAMIEIPPKFAGRPPVFPGLAESEIRAWSGAEGLAADVRAYGKWMRDEAERRIGNLYPKATLANGSEAVVIAWIWARTVVCPNPACGIDMPLVRSWWLGKKPGKGAYIEPYLVEDNSARGGRRFGFTIVRVPADSSGPTIASTIGRSGGTCLACSAAVELRYIRAQGKAKRISAQLMAIAAEGDRARIYLPSSALHIATAIVDAPSEPPDGSLPEQALGFRVQSYGIEEWTELFTPRQLTALTTFSDMVSVVRDRIVQEFTDRGVTLGQNLELGGSEGLAYAEAVATYLGIVVSRLTDYQSSLTTWASNPQMEILAHVFTRQALPMAWDFAEGNPFSTSSGTLTIMTEAVAKVLDRLTPGRQGAAFQADALSVDGGRMVISTDPPYYDNIAYADLSDFFYVWLRRSLKDVYPQLLSTVLVPKADEMIANPFIHGGGKAASVYFESKFNHFFERTRSLAATDFPITLYYAFKQTETSQAGESSTGWEMLLGGLVDAGWTITATWPVRSERSVRMRGLGSNALASSIVLALRTRPHDAPSIDRRGLIAALREDLPDAIRELQHGRIAPVDLPQAAIGPGMAIYSRYSSVIEGDGSPMRVGAALAHINEVLGEVQAEQEGDFDTTTRFAIAWFRQYGYAAGAFGAADDLARARATAVEAISRTGILTSGGGKVALIRPADLPDSYNPERDERISVWEVLHHLVRVLDTRGIDAAGRFLARVESRSDSAIDVDLVKELAFLLFPVAEENRWTKEAVSLNAVATAWPDILAAARGQISDAEQINFNFADDLDEEN